MYVLYLFVLILLDAKHGDIVVCTIGGVKSLVSRYIEGYSFWSI